MNKIVFIAKYPNKGNIKDGMIQRIKSVDIEFASYERVYLDISRRSNWAIRKEYPQEKVTVLRLNLFIHIFIVLKYLLLNSNFYIHSIYNFDYVKLLPLFRNKKISIDIHGSVPEELEFSGNYKLAKRMKRVERLAFRSASALVFVSEQMKCFYINKYPEIENKTLIVKPIFPANIFAKSSKENEQELRSELNISKDHIVFIYSGNLQKWQNFDMTIDYMSRNMSENYHLIILTGEPLEATEKVKQCQIPMSQVTIRSVLPNELSSYYNISHYGFILRDEHILNKVAAPTKLIEYLHYGLTPIVKYAEIGDAIIHQYDYISIENVNRQLPQIKSVKNRAIAELICTKSANQDLTSILS